VNGISLLFHTTLAFFTIACSSLPESEPTLDLGSFLSLETDFRLIRLDPERVANQQLLFWISSPGLVLQLWRDAQDPQITYLEVGTERTDQVYTGKAYSKSVYYLSVHWFFPIKDQKGEADFFPVFRFLQCEPRKAVSASPLYLSNTLPEYLQVYSYESVEATEIPQGLESIQVGGEAQEQFELYQKQNARVGETLWVRITSKDQLYQKIITEENSIRFSLPVRVENGYEYRHYWF
jgi:hypothetical protein